MTDQEKGRRTWERINNQELLGGAALLVIFVVIKFFSMRLPDKVSTYPVFMSNVGLLLACALFARCLYRLKKGTLAPAKAVEEKRWFSPRYVLAVVLLAAYAVLFKPLGCILSSFLFMLVFSQLFGQTRNLKLGLAVSAGFTAVIYLGFGVFLGIPLPTLFL